MNTVPHEQQDTSPIARLARIIGRAARFEGDIHGLGTGELAALARLDPDGDWRPHQVAALSRALIQAGIDPDRWSRDESLENWRRWALIAHGIALTGHAKGFLGEQLYRSGITDARATTSPGISEARVTKLLTARGDAFRQLVPRLLRLLAAKETAPNWHELGRLILHENRNEEKAETIRMNIAGRYFSMMAKSAA